MKFFVIPLLLLLFGGCSSIPQKGWPVEIPPRHYFTDYYALDPEHQKITTEKDYLIWIHRFYFGWELYGRGWLKTTDELIATIDNVEDKQRAKNKMMKIGRLVSPEWAKDSNYRVINTLHLSIWGNALNESIVKKEPLVTLDKVLTDVKQLLNRTLIPEDIVYSRYYEEKVFGSSF